MGVIKVKHEELKNVKNVMKNDGDSLDQELDALLKNIEKLRTIWQGQDSDFFCNNTLAYIDKMKKIPVAMRTISDFIDKADNGYSDHDEAFSRELQTEVDNYDESDGVLQTEVDAK